jgi:hypothetical protein
VTISISEQQSALQQRQGILTVSVVFDSTAGAGAVGGGGLGLKLFPMKEDEELFVTNLKENLECCKFEI